MWMFFGPHVEHVAGGEDAFKNYECVSVDALFLPRAPASAPLFSHISNNTVYYYALTPLIIPLSS